MCGEAMPKHKGEGEGWGQGGCTHMGRVAMHTRKEGRHRERNREGRKAGNKARGWALKREAE